MRRVWKDSTGCEIPHIEEVSGWLRSVGWQVLESTVKFVEESDTRATLYFTGKLDGLTDFWRDYTYALTREPAITQPALKLPEDTDRIVAALVSASIPNYRNSDRCPKPGCGKRMDFVRMDMVCSVHGAR